MRSRARRVVGTWRGIWPDRLVARPAAFFFSRGGARVPPRPTDGSESPSCAVLQARVGFPVRPRSGCRRLSRRIFSGRVSRVSGKRGHGRVAFHARRIARSRSPSSGGRESERRGPVTSRQDSRCPRGVVIAGTACVAIPTACPRHTRGRLEGRHATPALDEESADRRAGEAMSQPPVELGPAGASDAARVAAPWTR